MSEMDELHKEQGESRDILPEAFVTELPVKAFRETVTGRKLSEPEIQDNRVLVVDEEAITQEAINADPPEPVAITEKPTEPGVLPSNPLAFDKIVKWPDKLLTTKSETIEDADFGPELFTLAAQLRMMTLMYKGLGMSAVQLGVLKRMFVMRDQSKEANFITVINPSIIYYSEKKDRVYEGCLSLPGVSEQVQRSFAITANCTLLKNGKDGDGKDVIERHEGRLDLEGIPARVFQHEFEHLEGRMYFDRIDRQRRKLLLKKYEFQTQQIAAAIARSEAQKRLANR